MCFTTDALTKTFKSFYTFCSDGELEQQNVSLGLRHRAELPLSFRTTLGILKRLFLQKS